MKIEIAVGPQASQRLNRLFSDLRDTGPAMRDISARLYKETMGYFQAQGRPGEPWAELSERTKNKRRKGRGEGEPRILLDTGRMRNDIKPEYDSTQARVGATIYYAEEHQLGVKEKHMPARPWLPTEERATEIAIDVLEAQQKEAVK